MDEELVYELVDRVLRAHLANGSAQIALLQQELAAAARIAAQLKRQQLRPPKKKQICLMCKS